MLWDPLNFWPAGRRWIWAALALVSCSILSPFFIIAIRPPKSVTVDYFQDWASARNWRNGLPIYTEHRTTLPLYLAKTDMDDVKVNAHPPTSVLLAIPFSYFDFVDARFTWNLVSLGLMAISLELIRRNLGIPFSPWAVFPLLTLLLWCGPLFFNLILGQLNLVLLILIISAWSADRSGRPLLAGALLGTAVAIKLFPGFLFVYFASRRQWKVVVAGIGTLALVTGLAMVLFGFETFSDYYRVVLPQVNTFRSAWHNSSLPSFWAKLLDPDTEEQHVEPLWRQSILAKAGETICSATVLIYLIRVIRRANTQFDRDHAYGLSITAMLLVSPLTWDHSYILLLLPIATLWIRLSHSLFVRGLFLVSTIIIWIWILPVYDAMIPGGRAGGLATPVDTITILSCRSYALITLFGLGVVAAFRGWDNVLTSRIIVSSVGQASPGEEGPLEERPLAMVPTGLTGLDGTGADLVRPSVDGPEDRG